MAGGCKDKVPMLSDTHSQLSDDCMDVELQRLPTKSASMPISRNGRGAYEGETSLVSHIGPFQSERKTPFIPLGGPSFNNRKSGKLFRPMHGLLGHKKASIMAEEFSSVNGAGQDRPDDNFVGKNEHLLKSRPLGRCNDPYCTTCPTYYNFKLGQHKKSEDSSAFETKFHNALHGDAKGWVRRSLSFLDSYVPGIMNPHAKVIRHWNKFFLTSCLMAMFIDPLFFFMQSVKMDSTCIAINWSLVTTIAVVRSVNDFIYLLHMLLQFRLAYVAPESRVVGAGDLVDNPKRIAVHYLRGYFIVDLFVLLPLPQIMMLLVILKPKYSELSETFYFRNIIHVSVLISYIPRIFRFVCLITNQFASGFVFGSVWTNFVINNFLFVLAGHVVGSTWYLFGVERLKQCLLDSCRSSTFRWCKEIIICGRRNNENFISNPDYLLWNDSGCFDTANGPFDYGIYNQAIAISTKQNIVSIYISSFCWGFQQISTLAGNLTPSGYVLEVLFTIFIIGMGLILFPLLVGNMQNVLQAVGRRSLEMQVRLRDVEHWMSQEQLPEELRRQVRQSDRFNWATTRGVNEERLLENMSEGLQREIRLHLFKFVKKVRIFTLMDEPILDAICERLSKKLYVGGSKILYRGGPIEKMVFVVRGKMESDAGYGNITPLSEGDVCGEELLTWCLDNSSVIKDGRKLRSAGQRLISNRTVRCVTNVKAFTLRAADLEGVTSFFAQFLRNPRVQGAIRYGSPYLRAMAATHIQVAWRYRQKRLNRTYGPKRTA
ncbi:putative cyclic nucleotide-gated ion channel 20, chloroplastic isoform X2 [Tasmannia lanceolata]|uniref:putative cyclic nucleotide-gated ion channel 20, chloroplastic isoform X2 n=1 Tax=Tasmannia lanceolata TaxID=3420 RepID=UPI0040636A4D